jgi:hypothetical protein
VREYIPPVDCLAPRHFFDCPCGTFSFTMWWNASMLLVLSAALPAPLCSAASAVALSGEPPSRDSAYRVMASTPLVTLARFACICSDCHCFCLTRYSLRQLVRNFCTCTLSFKGCRTHRVCSHLSVTAEFETTRQTCKPRIDSLLGARKHLVRLLRQVVNASGQSTRAGVYDHRLDVEVLRRRCLSLAIGGGKKVGSLVSNAVERNAFPTHVLEVQTAL